MWLTGPQHQWVVLGSFTPRLYSETLISPIRDKWNLLNLTLGSRYHFHPESTLWSMIVRCTRRPWRYSPLLTRELVLITFAIHCHRYIPMDICMHLPFSWSFLVALVVTRCLEIFSIVLRILWVYCLAVLFLVKTLTVISSHLSRIHASQLFMCLTKFFWILFDLSKILCSMLLLKFLPACIMVNSIWLVVFINIPCLSHFEPIDSMCAYAHSHQVILFKIIFPAQASFRTWVGSWHFKPLLIVQLSVFNLSILDQSACFWSFVLETIISFYLSFILIRWFLNMIPLHSSSSKWVPILTSAPLWITRSIVGLLTDSVLHIQSPCEFFPWYIMPLVNCITFLCQPCSTIKLVLFTFETWGICY